MTLLSRAELLIDSWVDLLSQLVPLAVHLIYAVCAISMALRPGLLGLLLATLVSLLAMNSFWLTHGMARRTALNIELRSRQTHIINTFLCWQMIAECQKIGFEKRRQHAKSDVCRQTRQEIEESSLTLEACQESLAMVSLLAACYVVLNDGADYVKPEHLLTLLIYWTRTTDSLRQCIKLYTRILHGRQNATLLRSALMKKPTVAPCTKSSEFEFKGGAIELEDVNFGYSSRSEVVKSLSFQVEAGQKVALVGPTGSGKSTICRLLSRHFDPKSGRVLVDGQDLRYVSLESYRKALGVVSQNSVLMNVSIRENVAYPCVDAPLERVVSACRAAEIHDTIMRLPQQYESEVGDLAAKLSGGETQRLVLARLYMQDPKIVLLDEATSNLDGMTEQKILSLLNTFFHERTVIIITHRLSTIQNVDKILVIKDGEKVEEGTHTELIAKESGLYLAALKAQNPAF
ncbi:hypothetical protein PRZ48_009940 [Zasmidium cellare]|uniref:ABC transporter domain-containing protein n=1 Tax=Zasmidium cellare TaxID=395010 RepID=A0ABR0ED54_ZASCE|nr:hypothetical protein PRZ48_009940 [Zasmidium cellare]